MSGLRRRVLRVAESEWMRQAAADPILPFLLISPGEWPPQDEAAYWAAEAAEDRDVMDDLVERHTGQRPAPPGANQRVIRLRDVPSPVR